jgi:hypothetical protein
LNSAAGAFVISDFEIVEVDDAPFSGSGGTVFTVFKQNSFVGSEFAAILELAQGAYASGSYGNRMITSLQGAAFSADKIIQKYNGADVWWPIRIENGPPVIACYTNDSTNTINYGNGQVTGTVGYYAEDLGDDSRIYYCLGDDMTSGDHFNGYICEIIIYNKVLTDAERQSVEYYLSRKWAIPLKGRVTTNLADGTNTTISDSGPVEITHLNTFYFPNPDDGNCDLRLEGNEITIADNLPWTMEFWIKRHTRGDARNVYGGVWGNEYGTGEKERLQFTTSVSEDKLVLVDDGNNNASTVITNSVDIDCLHKWRHVVFAFDGTTDATTAGCVRQYVDGQDKGPTIALVNADSKITIKRIGSRGGTSDNNRLEGELGNFRVYNKQLSHAEVLQNYNAQRAKYQNKKMSFAAPDNLKLYLDAQSGTSSNYYADGIWYDLSDQNNDATRLNATFTDEGVKSYDFDGGDDSFSIGSSGMNVSTTAITVAVWVSFDAIGDDWIISTDNGSDYDEGWTMRVDSPSNTIGWIVGKGGSNSSAWSTNTLSVDSWYYAVATYKSGEQLLYVDGVLWASGTSTGSIDYGSVTTGYVGARNPGTGLELVGKLANVMIYDTVLSADQVMQNYNYFKHRFGK